MVGKGPQKVLKIRFQLTKRVANQESESQALIMVPVRVVLIRFWFSIMARLLSLKKCEESKVWTSSKSMTSSVPWSKLSVGFVKCWIWTYQTSSACHKVCSTLTIGVGEGDILGL